MKHMATIVLTAAVMLTGTLRAQEQTGTPIARDITHTQKAQEPTDTLTRRQQRIVEIAACTGRGDLESLRPALAAGLDDSLTVSEIRELLIHSYAYCGFPRSLRALQTFIAVLGERKAQGISDAAGRDASPVTDSRSRYDRGRDILAETSGIPADAPKTGYAEFAPIIERFLKEHLFADLFERDVLTYAERELATVSVIAALGESVQPMLRGHLGICRNLGYAQALLDQALAIAQTDTANPIVKDVFQKGEKLPDTSNFTGEAWLSMFVTKADSMDCTVGNVTFAPGVRNSWHSHPGGQILLCASGEGRYQEKGKPVQVLHPSDVVKIAPNVVHWHGAAPDSKFTHIAIGPQQSKSGAV